jgi:hypothetical protein
MTSNFAKLAQNPRWTALKVAGRMLFCWWRIAVAGLQWNWAANADPRIELGRAMGDYSSILFARPSFVEGMARILDFGNSLFEYNRSETPAQADFNALRSDMAAIAEDMRRAISSQQRHDE